MQVILLSLNFMQYIFVFCFHNIYCNNNYCEQQNRKRNIILYWKLSDYLCMESMFYFYRQALSASVPLLIIIYHCICFMLGVNYNIPLCVLLQEDHPLVPPLVYVRPTNSMVIIPSQHVDTEGRVYHPYLNQWDPVNVCSS